MHIKSFRKAKSDLKLSKENNNAPNIKELEALWFKLHKRSCHSVNCERTCHSLNRYPLLMFHQNNWPIDHLHHQETKSIWFTKSFLISWFNTESAFPWLTKISCHYQGHIPMTLAIIHSFTKEPVIYIRWKIEWKQIQALSFIAGGPRGALKWNFSIFEKIMTDHPAKRPTDTRKVSLPISNGFFTQRHIKENKNWWTG